MKIVEDQNPKTVAFSSLAFGDVFRHGTEVAIKIHPIENDHGCLVKAISLEDGKHYSFLFNNEHILVEPLNDRATLVID